MLKTTDENIFDVCIGEPEPQIKTAVAESTSVGFSPGIHFLKFTYDNGKKCMEFAMSTCVMRVLQAQIAAHLNDEMASARGELRREWEDAQLRDIERQARETKHKIEKQIDRYAEKENH